LFVCVWVCVGIHTHTHTHTHTQTHELMLVHCVVTSVVRVNIGSTTFDSRQRFVIESQ
jgi:hypothetical protein